MRRGVKLMLCAAAAMAVVAWLALQAWPESEQATASAAQQASASSGGLNAQASSPFAGFNTGAAPSLAHSSTAPLSAEGQRQREEKLAQARSRYERAEQAYNSYRDATRYPFDSRPISEHPDRVRPFDPVVEEKTMRDAQGNPVKGITLKTAQDRVFMSGSDTVKFTVQALDSQGQVLPMIIQRAAAQSIPDGKQLVQQRSATLDFSDAGPAGSATGAGTGGVDDVAGDGQYSARFAPQTQGFAAAQGFAGGTIRVLVFVKADGKEGVAHFDVIYTDETPATWEAGVREAKEEGSLNFYLKAQVRVPGRYVASVRVDDARGQPFALLSFNQELAAGARELKFHLFGALIRDKRPAFPLKLRDAEGFLLLADKFPDRLMMARRAGLLHTSASYSTESFSPAEWSSEERDRYLAEYGSDVDRARSQLDQLLR
jgi:hypothetical protein